MKGVQRINRVISKFTNLVNELDKGIAEINEKVSSNNSVVAELQDRNTSLFDTRAIATKVAENLKKLIEN